jgi:hypothetical protein
MENQLKNAKEELLKDELADFEFNAKMENRVLEELKTTRKETHLNSKRFLPVLLSACLIALFFGGLYTFVMKSDSGGSNADDSDQNITVKEEDTTTPPEKEIPILQEENDEETIEPEPNTEQQEETTVPEQTEVVEPVYFDQEFVTLAEKGFLKGIPFQVGTTVGEIKAHYGEPLEYGAIEGAFTMEYEEISFFYYARVTYDERVNVKDDELITGIRLIPKEELYLHDMKTALGEPAYEGMNDMNNTFVAQFEMDHYILRARNDSGADVPLKYVDIINKN